MKEKILKLRSEGKSYIDIKKLLGCSLSTISYYCGENQKEKTLNRTRKYSKTIRHILKRKKDNFSFIHGRNKHINKGKRGVLNFTAEEFKIKLENNPTCYLTGRAIDISRPKSYHCDHITPISRGGDCSFNNLGLACKEANMAKSNLTVEEFISLCQEVLTHNGYKVEKI